MATETGIQRKKLQPRTHPDQRPKIDALNAIGHTLHGAPPEKTLLSYYTPLLIQCTLPHSDPKAPAWVKTNGEFTLMVTSGIDKEGAFYGIPYGSFPRLTLAYIITEVMQTKERRIELASHFSGFLKEIGYTGNFRGSIRPAKAVQSQLLRLLSANVAFEKNSGDSEQGTMVTTPRPFMGVELSLRSSFKRRTTARPPPGTASFGPPRRLGAPAWRRARPPR